MARFFYSLAVYALLPWAFLHLLWRARHQPEYLRHWGERLGFFQQRSATSPLIWLHAVSVGETRAAQPLIAALRVRYPQHQILLTHMTPTGRATSMELFGDSIQRCYLPYDTKSAVRRFLGHFQPQFGLILETELWPNLIATCRQRKVSLILVNARMSERSANRYALLPGLSRQALTELAGIAAISSADRSRLASLSGAAENNIVITGNMKFDIRAPQQQIEMAASIRAGLGTRLVFLAASTREGEEALILDAWLAAARPDSRGRNSAKGVDIVGLPPDQKPNESAVGISPVGAGATPLPLLIVVPRHPQRFDEVAAMIDSRGLRMKRRSDNAPVDIDTEVLLGDSMGEMFAWYATADVAFVGGSLLDYGSQNLIEACAVGTPVLIGPSTYNFAEAADEAVTCGAASRVADATSMVSQALSLLAAPEARSAMNEAGLAFAHRHRGATARTMELIVRVTDK